MKEPVFQRLVFLLGYLGSKGTNLCRATPSWRDLELDATLASPHAVLGSSETYYDWNFAGGEAEFKKALQRDPNDATAHQWYADSF